MTWTEQIFRYCERGQDPGFWAEPFNALSSAAFIVAGLMAALAFPRPTGLAASGLAALAPASPSPGTRRALAGLIGLALTIGVGSFLFHTYATRWSSVADVGPIGLFMFAYLVFALRVLLGLPWSVVVAGMAAFVLALSAAGTARCRPGVQSLVAVAHGACLNGSLGYAPALAAMLGVAGVLVVLGHPAWRLLAQAALVFMVSLTLRTLDMELCPSTLLFGRLRGTHALWHILNGLTLYLLLLAAIRHGRGPSSHEAPPPLRT